MDKKLDEWESGRMGGRMDERNKRVKMKGLNKWNRR